MKNLLGGMGIFLVVITFVAIAMIGVSKSQNHSMIVSDEFSTVATAAAALEKNEKYSATREFSLGNAGTKVSLQKIAKKIARDSIVKSKKK